MRKIVEKLFMLLLGCFVVGAVFSLSCPAYTNSIPNKEINIWHKVSTDEFNPGEIIALDMSRGYAACEGPLIYIVVQVVGSDEEVIIAFPNGGYWAAPEADPFLQELQKEFDSLEQYLKSNQSTPLEKR